MDVRRALRTAVSAYVGAELNEQTVRGHGALARPSVSVEHGEVVGQDRDGEREQDRAGDGADGVDHEPEARDGRHVAVADRRDRYQAPPTCTASSPVTAISYS